MWQAKMERSTVTYSAAISAGETTRQWRRALELLYAMGLVKLERSTTTCSAAISACKKGGGWQRPLEILRARRAIVDRDTYT